MKQTIVYIGIDVAKAHLDVAWQNRLRRFDNDKAGRATLVKWIKQKQSDPVQVICEASGGYEQELLDALAEAALTVSLVQATRGATVRSGGRHPGQDRQSRCSCAGSFWGSDAARAHLPAIGCTEAFAQTGIAAPALKLPFSSRAKPARATQ